MKRNGTFIGGSVLVVVLGFWATQLEAGGMGGEDEAIGQKMQEPVQRQEGGTQFSYPVDFLNHPYPLTPKYVWRAMFPGIQERMDAERHAIGVPGRAAEELAYYRQATLHPNRIRHEVGKVIDTGRHYVGGGWTRLDTTKGIVWVYNPRLDPWVSALAPQNRAITREVESDLDCQLGYEAPGYYDANGFRVAKGDPSAVRLVGKSRQYRR